MKPNKPWPAAPAAGAPAPARNTRRPARWVVWARRVVLVPVALIAVATAAAVVYGLALTFQEALAVVGVSVPSPWSALFVMLWTWVALVAVTVCARAVRFK
jgi:hypothetical protein